MEADIQAEKPKGEPFRETTTPFLRPHQVQTMHEEARRLGGMLDSNAPPHLKSAVQDRPAATKQLRRIKAQIESQAPRPYERHEVDKARARMEELEAQIVDGMPTQQEMRRNPPGAVDRHRQWEAKNKNRILEYRNIRQRLHAGGQLGDLPVNARDIGNIERIRPGSHSGELPMDGAQIPQKTVFLPPADSEPAVVFSQEDLDLLKELEPDTAAKLCMASAADRNAVLQILRSVRASESVEVTESVETETPKKRRGRPPKNAT